MSDSTVKQLSYQFAVEAKKICKKIASDQREFNMTDQLSRSSSSICANLAEADFAASRADFLNKMTIALKEANESKLWVNMLHDTEYLSTEEYDSLIEQVSAIISILVASVKTLKASLNRN